MPDGRFVWITREQRDMLLRWNRIGTPSRIVAAWDAAPADPVEAAVNAYVDFDQRGSLEQQFAHVLATLGLPSSDETTG